MSVTSTSELLTEAAGVKIYMTEDRSSIDSSITGKISITLENINEVIALGKNCGLHLTKSKWDPYPWINYIDAGSLSDRAGLRAGDCLIGVNGKDLIGLKIKEIASLIYSYQECNLNLLVWRYDHEEEEQEAGSAIKGPLPDVASKLANAVSAIVRTLECPVCLESSMPPVSQCVHGHIICVGCRPRTPRCPICRVRLGQGRCLLADKLHKIFRDVFSKKENLCNDEKCTQNLRDWLFGKNTKKSVMRVPGRDHSTSTKGHKLLLRKLFRSGLEKAASADNLSVVTDDASSVNVSINNLNHIERLNASDRTKSASTGELSNETEKSNVKRHLQINVPSTTMSSTCSLMSNVSLTPVWGGSLESISCIQLMCPLSKQNVCTDIITRAELLEHLSETHGMPQVHFYSTCVKLPIPFPFGPEAMYILHGGSDLFFFQWKNETIWISSTITGETAWEWILLGEGINGVELKIQRRVASLGNPMVLSLEHMAPLPSALLLHTLNIQLKECSGNEQNKMSKAI